MDKVMLFHNTIKINDDLSCSNTTITLNNQFII